MGEARAPSPAAPAPDGDGPAPCPACGGVVEDRGATGVCTECGLELEAVPQPPAGRAVPGLAKSLAKAITDGLRQGLEVEAAVIAALDLHGIGEAALAPSPAPGSAPPAPGPQAEPGSQRAGRCPVCAGALAPGAEACSGCGLSLRDKGRAACPRCGDTADVEDGECACGALLSLKALEERFDASVTQVCVRCKQLYTGRKDACRDCGGRLISADGLRALFARG